MNEEPTVELCLPVPVNRLINYIATNLSNQEAMSLVLRIIDRHLDEQFVGDLIAELKDMLEP